MSFPRQLKKMLRASCLTARLLFLVGTAAISLAASVEQSSDAPPPPHTHTHDLPTIILKEPVTSVSEFLACGPWEIPSRGSWENAPAPLPFGKKGTLMLQQLESPPFSSKPVLLAGNTRGGVDYSPFTKAASNWNGHHVVLLACKVTTSKRTRVSLDISNDDYVGVYVNARYLGVVSNTPMPQGGQLHAFPAWLEKGENILVFKQLATRRAPRFKVNIVTDGSSDFDSAWSRQEGLLTRLVYPPNTDPSVQWPAMLKDLAIEAQVTDVFSRESFNTGPLHRGDILIFPDKEERTDGDVDLDIRGTYSIRYKKGRVWAEELFFVGDPLKMKAQLETCVKRLCQDTKTRINAETLLRRLEILCEPDNYKLNDRKWQEKTAHAICSLAALLGAIECEVADSARDVPGLHIRGFSSALDDSMQHYRLFVPSSYKRGQKLPLLVVLPTSISASQRPFIESPFMANHRDAVRMGRVAERYGFAVLWSGYRNAPAGLPCESAHLDEVIKAVQADYDLDLQKIHLYGVCSGGIFAGNAVARWPNRFASIIYNRAIFTRASGKMDNLPRELRDRLQYYDPTESILSNKTISLFLTNTENVDVGHGEIELTNEFLEKAAGVGKTVTADMSPPDIDDTYWDRVFQWASSCRLKNPEETISDRNRLNGYSGPAVEVFTTPMIIVQGTLGSEDENNLIEKFIQSFQRHYADLYYGAVCRNRKDTEISDAEIASHSLIIIGNEKTNKLWSKMQENTVLRVAGGEVALGNHRWDGKFAYHFGTKKKYELSTYVLFIGATDVQDLRDYPIKSLFENVYDFELWRVHPMKIPKVIICGKLQDILAQPETNDD